MAAISEPSNTTRAKSKVWKPKTIFDRYYHVRKHTEGNIPMRSEVIKRLEEDANITLASPYVDNREDAVAKKQLLLTINSTSSTTDEHVQPSFQRNNRRGNKTQHFIRNSAQINITSIFHELSNNITYNSTQKDNLKETKTIRVVDTKMPDIKDVTYEESMETFRKMYADAIKSIIIEKLDLPQAQNMANRYVPEFLKWRMSGNPTRNDDTGSATTSAIVIPSNETLYHKRKFSFTLNPNITRKISEIRTATIWIYKTRHQLTMSNKITLSLMSRDAIYKYHDKMGNESYWMSFDVTNNVAWLIGRMLHGFEESNTLDILLKCREKGFKRYRSKPKLLCPVIKKGERRPMLDIQMEKKPRKRRNSDMCPPGQVNVACCREELIVNLTDISYIWEPSTFRADFCRGTCNLAEMGRGSSPVANYARHLHLHSQYTSDPRFSTGCCVSTQRDPLSIGYFDSDNNFISAVLAGMQVKGCGCRV